MATTDNVENEELRFMYDKLRNEILHNDVAGLQLLAGTLLLVSTGMGFGFNSDTSDLLRIFAFLSVFIIVCITIVLDIERMKSTFFIATYLRVFIEPFTTHLKWETALQEFRKKYPSPAFKRYTSILFIYDSIAVLNVLLVVFYTLVLYGELDRHVHRLSFWFINFTIKNSWIALLFVLGSMLALINILLYESRQRKKYVNDNAKTLQPEWELIYNKVHKRPPTSSTNENQVV